MNEGAREANEGQDRRAQAYREDRIIALLEEIRDLLLTQANPPVFQGEGFITHPCSDGVDVNWTITTNGTSAKWSPPIVGDPAYIDKCW